MPSSVHEVKKKTVFIEMLKSKSQFIHMIEINGLKFIRENIARTDWDGCRQRYTQFRSTATVVVNVLHGAWNVNRFGRFRFNWSPIQMDALSRVHIPIDQRIQSDFIQRSRAEGVPSIINVRKVVAGPKGDGIARSNTSKESVN